MMNWLKNVNAILTIDTSTLVKKIEYNTKTNEIENYYMIIIMINTLLPLNLIS